MTFDIRTNRVLWLLTAALTLIAAAIGLARPSIYEPVVRNDIIPGVFTQDILAVVAALVLMSLALVADAHHFRKAIICFGVLGFIFYAYGIYVIEQIYTSLYPLYLALFGMSLFSLIYGLVSIKSPPHKGLTLPAWLRIGSAGFAVFVAVIFNLIWLGQLLPLLRTADRIEYTFSVYIIDLALIMPAFLISAILALQDRLLGLVGLPGLFIVGVGILSPLALAELIKPARYGMPMDSASLGLFGILATLFLALVSIYLTRLRPDAPRKPGTVERFAPGRQSNIF